MATENPAKSRREELQENIRKNTVEMGVLTGRTEAFSEAADEVTKRTADIMALVSNPTESIKVSQALTQLAIDLLSKHQLQK